MDSYAPPSEPGYPPPESPRHPARNELAQALVLVVTFLVLMLAGSVVGLKVMTSAPEPEAAAPQGGAHSTSRVTYKSADGLTCRQLEFDNRTGLAREGKPEPCYQGPPAYRQRSFIWGR